MTDEPTTPDSTESASPTPAPATPEKSDQDKKKKDEPQGIWRGWVRPLLTVVIVVTALRSSLVDWNDVPTGSMEPTVAVGDRIVVNKLSYSLNPPFNGPVIAIPFTPISFTNPLDFLPGVYWGGPENNDIVTFWKPGGIYEPSYQMLADNGVPEDKAREAATVRDGGIRMVKRVVAGPGDKVEMRYETKKFDGRNFELSVLIINGEEAQYSDKKGVEVTESIGGIVRRVQYVRNDPKEMARRNNQLDIRLANFGPIELGEDEYLMIGDNRDNSQDGRFFGPVKLTEITGKAKFVAVSFDGSYFKPAWGRFFMGFDKDLAPEE